MLLWVKLSSWASRPLRALAHLGADDVDGQLAALGDLVVAGVAPTSRVDPDRVPSLTRSKIAGDRRCRPPATPGLDQQLRARGWGSGRRSSGRR